MPLRIICPSCGRSGRAPENALGRNAVCPACGTRYKITSSVLAPEDPEVGGETPSTIRPSAVSSSPYPLAASPPRPSPGAEPEYPDLPRDPWPVRKAATREPVPERPLWIYGAIAGGGVAAVALCGLVVWLVFLRGKPDGPGARESASAWTRLTPSDAGFSVSMPGKPEPQTRVESLPDGSKLEHHVYFAEAKPSSYVVNYNDLDYDVDPSKVAKLFDDVRDEGVRARHSKVVEEKDIQLDGHPGRERLEELDGAGGPVILKFRVYLVGRRLYTLMASGPKNADTAAHADKFLVSFRVQSTGPKTELNPAVKADSSPVVNVTAEAPVAKVAGRSLRYGWKPSKSYVYSVHIGIDQGRGTLALDGGSVYRVKSVDSSGMTLAHSGWMVTRRHTKDGTRPQGDAVRGPENTRGVELKINPDGALLSANGEAPLPLLGDLPMLIIDPLPAGNDDAWNDESDITLNEVHVDPSGPLRVGRTSLRDRVGRERPRAGSRLRRGARPAPPRPQAKVTTTAHPAHEKSSYALVAESGETVTIARTYILNTEETVGGEPLLQFVGNGTTTFDVAQGVPLALEFKAVVTSRSAKGIVQIPLDVRCRLLQGAERELAVRPPVMPPTPLQPRTEAQVHQLTGDLKSRENERRKQACQLLYNSAPLDSERAEVVRALDAMLDDTDMSIRVEVIRALGVWGDAAAAKSLIYRLNNDRYGARRELFEALGRIGPADVTTEAMIAWLSRESGEAGRVLRAQGAAAEPALLRVVRDGTDTRLRAEACRVLRDIGTERSLEVLNSFAQKRGDEEAARSAENAMRRIEERRLTPEKLAKALEILKSTDNGQRTRTAEWLASVKPAPDRRAEVARALEPLLDIPDLVAEDWGSRALAVWGDAQSAVVLREHVLSRTFEGWREAALALVALAPTEEAAKAIAMHVEQDRGHVFRIFRTMGPVAEKPLIEILNSKADWPVRADASNVLRFVGTKRCIPALEGAAKNRRDGIAAGAAEEALKAIAERKITSESLNTALAALRSQDANQRRAVLKRVANVDVQDDRRAKISRAVEAALRAETDDGLQREAIQVLALWGDDQTPRFLGERINDPGFRPWREAAEALGRLAPGDASAEVVLARLKDDQGLVEKVIREMKPFPEKTVLKLLLEDPNPGVRRAMGGFLEQRGSDDCLATLKPLAGQLVPGELGSVAEEAVRAITERL